jgi:hypothetical protein
VESRRAAEANARDQTVPPAQSPPGHSLWFQRITERSTAVPSFHEMNVRRMNLRQQMLVLNLCLSFILAKHACRTIRPTMSSYTSLVASKVTAFVARQQESAAKVTTRSANQSDAPDSAETTIDDYNYGTSKIVRTAVVSGVIVLVLTALVLFFKVSTDSRVEEPMLTYHRSPPGSDTINDKEDKQHYIA